MRQGETDDQVLDVDAHDGGGRLCSAVTAVACTVSPPLNGGGGDVGRGDEPTVPAGDDTVRLNQLQFIGSHNSYHVAPEAPILNLLTILSNAVPDIASALGDPALLNYTHAPLPTQLQRGVRSFELDIAADPEGGKFADPLHPQPVPPRRRRADRVDQPGMKVVHIQDIDFRSTCPTLVGLPRRRLKTWSDAHPDHLPITINLELKEDQLPAPFDATQILPVRRDAARRGGRRDPLGAR